MKTTEKKKSARTREAKPKQPREKEADGKRLGYRLLKSFHNPLLAAYEVNVSGEMAEKGRAAAAEFERILEEERAAAAEFERTLVLIEESRQRAQRTQKDIDRLKRQTRAILDKLLTNP